MQLTLGPALGVAIAVLALFATLFIRLGMLSRPRDVLTAVTRATPAVGRRVVGGRAGAGPDPAGRAGDVAGCFVGMLSGGASPIPAGAVQLLVSVGLLAVQALAVLIIVELVAAGCFPLIAV